MSKRICQISEYWTVCLRAIGHWIIIIVIVIILDWWLISCCSVSSEYRVGPSNSQSAGEVVWLNLLADCSDFSLFQVRCGRFATSIVSPLRWVRCYSSGMSVLKARSSRFVRRVVPNEKASFNLLPGKERQVFKGAPTCFDLNRSSSGSVSVPR